MAVSPFAAELETYAKLIGGNMIYIPEHMSWTITFPVPDGKTQQIRIDEGTPLDDAVRALATAYEETHRRKSDV